MNSLHRHITTLYRGGSFLFWFFFTFLSNVLKSGVWLCDREVDPVLKAIKDGDVGTLRRLIKKADCNLLIPNEYGWIPLHEAAHYGQEQCIKALLRGGTTAAITCIQLSGYKQV